MTGPWHVRERHRVTGIDDFVETTRCLAGHLYVGTQRDGRFVVETVEWWKR